MDDIEHMALLESIAEIIKEKLAERGSTITALEQLIQILEMNSEAVANRMDALTTAQASNLRRGIN